MSDIIVDILCEVLGKYKNHDESKGEINFDCPTCSEEKGIYDGDGKGNLQINYHINKFQCWACSQTHGTKGNIYRLLKKFGNKEQLKRYELLVPDEDYIEKKEKEKITGLDENFIPIIGGSGREHSKVIKYLSDRNVGEDIIKKYDFHYCLEGEYKGRIVVPSISLDGSFNYFVTRTYCNLHPKYKNPESDKNILIFNEGRISWDSTIYLVEGVFDHIVVPNSIPLLGKVVSDLLFEKIQSNCSGGIVICLDDDAWKDTISLYRKLNSGKTFNKVKVVKLPKGYDISEIHQKFGRKGVINILKNSFKIKESLL